MLKEGETREPSMKIPWFDVSYTFKVVVARKSVMDRVSGNWCTRTAPMSDRQVILIEPRYPTFIRFLGFQRKKSETSSTFKLLRSSSETSFPEGIEKSLPRNRIRMQYVEIATFWIGATCICEQKQKCVIGNQSTEAGSLPSDRFPLKVRRWLNDPKNVKHGRRARRIRSVYSE